MCFFIGVLPQEFTNIFNFAYSFINPSEAEVLPQGRAEDIIIDILKEHK